MHGIDGEPLFFDIVTNAVYSTRALFNLYKLTFVYLLCIDSYECSVVCGE